MFSKTWISKFTESFLDNAVYLKRAIEDADAILTGAGSGMSTAAGLTYGGDRFMRFLDFNEKYGIYVLIEVKPVCQKKFKSVQ